MHQRRENNLFLKNLKIMSHLIMQRYRKLGKEIDFIGKTNMDEFAMGSSTENHISHDKILWKEFRGSSGGSAPAFASNMSKSRDWFWIPRFYRQSLLRAASLKPT